MKKRCYTDERNRNLSIKNSGKNNPFYGKKHSEESRRKMSESKRGEKNHLWGKHHSEESRRKMSENSLKKYGEKNPMWKGDEVGFTGIHAWVRRNKRKSDVCEICGEQKPYDLANISGEYKRDINDYQWLCRKCHMMEDGRLNDLNKCGKDALKHYLEVKKNGKRTILY